MTGKFSWYTLWYLLSTVGFGVTSLTLGYRYSKLELENTALAKSRAAIFEQWNTDERRLEGTDPSCYGFNCSAMFTSSAAGVIATTYVYYEVPLAQWRDFCMSDPRVNQWRGYTGAWLAEFSEIDASSKSQPNLHIMQCGWIVPSDVWCKK